MFFSLTEEQMAVREAAREFAQKNAFRESLKETGT
jgi:hypothetical protein